MANFGVENSNMTFVIEVNGFVINYHAKQGGGGGGVMFKNMQNRPKSAWK